jgi:hypothetical protein
MVVEASVTERMPDTLLLPNTPAAGRVTRRLIDPPSAQDPGGEPAAPLVQARQYAPATAGILAPHPKMRSIREPG